MARPSPSCAHDDDRLRLPPASPPSSNSAEKKESTGPRLSQLCPPCATPFSNSSLDYRRSDARIVENGFAASSGVSKSAAFCLGVRAARQAHGKDRALARLARHRDVATHHASELACDRNPKPGAAEALRRRGFGLAELLEQLGLLFRCHADAGVGNGHLDP